MDGELGEGRTATNLTTAILGGREGEDGVGGNAGRPTGHGLVERKRGSRRSLWAQRRGEAVAVAMATLVGGDGRVRWRKEQRR